MANGPGPCRDAYVRGGCERLKNPLASGHYKLAELRTALHADYRFLQAIRHAHQLPKGRRHEATLPEDAAHWLKTLPARLCYRLGHDLCASILALEGDGVPSEHISRIGDGLERSTNVVIDWFEEAHQLLKTCGVEVEYSKMRRGESILDGPVREAIELVEWVLVQANHYRQAA